MIPHTVAMYSHPAVRNPSTNFTMAISPAAMPISGLTAMTTKVSFHPPMNPTMKPNTNVEILSMKIDTWSAMALLILLMSLSRNRYYIIIYIYDDIIYNTILCKTLSQLCTDNSLTCRLRGPTHSVILVFSSPTELQSNHPISICITFLK